MISISSNEWTINGIDGILFDKDGTLTDSHIYWGRIIERRAHSIIGYYSLEKGILKELCLSMGYCMSSKRLQEEGPIALVSREEVISQVDKFLLSKGVDSSWSILSDLFQSEHEAFLDEIFDYVVILPGVENFLNEVKKRGIKTAVVTTDSVKNTSMILKHLDLENYFDAVIGKESTKEPKVSGVPALEALKIMNIEADVSACIGDAPMDIIMAQKSGLKCGIAVATGQISSEKLKGYTPYVAESLPDIRLN